MRLALICSFIFYRSYANQNNDIFQVSDSESSKKVRLIFQNISNQPLIFEMDEENSFFLSKAKILEEIKMRADSEKLDLPMTTWKCVADLTEHDLPLTNSNWTHNPVVFLNSIGREFCDHRASVLAIIS